MRERLNGDHELNKSSVGFMISEVGGNLQFRLIFNHIAHSQSYIAFIYQNFSVTLYP